MMEKFRANFQKHPLAWFYAISLFIEIILIPIFIFTGADNTLEQAIQKTGISFNTDLVTALRVVLAEPKAFLGVFLAILQVAAPDIAVFTVVIIADGRQGFINLKNRFRFWGKGISGKYALKVWGICILTFNLMNLASAGLNKLLLPPQDFLWNINFLSINFVSGLLIAMFLDAGGLFEENGWRGFALPLLQKRYQPLKASLFLGFLWSMWHIPVKINLLFTYGTRNFILMFLVITVKFILLSIIMTYFFNKLGQTTIIAIAMHGLSNDSVRLGGQVLSESFISQQITEINLVIPLLVVTIYIIWRTRGKLAERCRLG